MGLLFAFSGPIGDMKEAYISTFLGDYEVTGWTRLSKENLHIYIYIHMYLYIYIYKCIYYIYIYTYHVVVSMFLAIVPIYIYMYVCNVVVSIFFPIISPRPKTLNNT